MMNPPAKRTFPDFKILSLPSISFRCNSYISQAFIEAALATFVIGDLDRKSGRSNQGAEVKTTLRPGSVFWSDNAPRLSL